MGSCFRRFAWQPQGIVHLLKNDQNVKGFAAFSTTTTTTPHHTYTTLQLQLHYTTFHYTALHYTPLHCTHYIPLHYTTLHYTTLPSTTLHYTTLHYLQLHYITLHYTTLHYTTLHYTTLHCTTLHYTTLSYTQLHYTTSQYTTLHYTTLHYSTLHLREVHPQRVDVQISQSSGLPRLLHILSLPPPTSLHGPFPSFSYLALGQDSHGPAKAKALADSISHCCAQRLTPLLRNKPLGPGRIEWSQSESFPTKTPLTHPGKPFLCCGLWGRGWP